MQAIVVTLDHLALAFLGCYGNTSISTPAFDGLAAGSVVFDQCFASLDSDSSLPGLAELANQLHGQGGPAVVHICDPGQPPDSALVKVISDFREAIAPDRNSLLWLKSPAAASPWTSSRTQTEMALGKSGSGDSLWEALSAALAELDTDLRPQAMGLDELFETTLLKLRTRGALQREAAPATPAIGKLRSLLYAAAVAEADAWLKDLLELLDAGRCRDTLLIVAAGRGDLPSGHPELATGCPRVVDPLLRVPLFVRSGTAADGTRRGALVTTGDIAPTVAEWLQQDTQTPSSRALSLWPLLRNEVHSVRDELLIGSTDAGWRLQTADFACVCSDAALRADPGGLSHFKSDRPRLFIKPDDIWDTLDVAREHPDVIEVMLSKIRDLAPSAPEESPGSTAATEF